jgi:long-chain acyl-CoA synthetase
MNLASLLSASAAMYPERTAVIGDGIRMTYADLNDAAGKVGALLARLGVRPATKVALICPNVALFPASYFGILRLGATVIPLNILLRDREIAYHLQDSGAEVVVCFEGTTESPVGVQGYAGFLQARADGAACRHFVVVPVADQHNGPPAWAPEAATLTDAFTGRYPVAPLAEVSDDDTAVILYTSGTTGRPKGAELRHRNLYSNALTARALFDLDAARPDVFLAALPLFHSFGQTVVQNAAVAHAGTLVMMPRFDARQALQLMIDEGVTVFAGVPTMYWALLRALDEEPYDAVDSARLTQTLRTAVSGGAPLPAEVHRAAEKRLSVAIQEGYGLSETSPIAAFTERGAPARIGSIGRPVPGVEMKLIDPSPGVWTEIPPDPDAVGEIAIKGPNVMKGYINRPDATAEVLRDGWFRSGDLARRDGDGWYYVVDRSKDMIIRGGFNVYPREVEEVLLSHPDVSLAAVVGVPHPSHGEEVKAFVIPANSAAALTPDAVVAWAREHMASYKYPRLVEIVDELPMTATGKILKRALVVES